VPSHRREKARGRVLRFTDRRPLRKTGLKISPICLGMVSAEDAVCAAFDAGVNFFFLTADLHWPLYEASRRGLEKLLARDASVRRQVVVGITSYTTHPGMSFAAMGEVLDAVPGLGTIDVAIIGGAYGPDFLRRLHESQALRREGCFGVKAIGATFHDRQAALLATNHGLVDISFVRYNPSHPGARRDLFPQLHPERRTPLYSFTSTWNYVSPARCTELTLADDYWRPRFTDYHRFALTRPEIDGLLCAPGTPEEVRELAWALEEGPLDRQEEQYLIDLAALHEGRASLVPERPSRTQKSRKAT